MTQTHYDADRVADGATGTTSVSELIRLLASLLPESRPASLEQPLHALAALTHATFVDSGFVLRKVGGSPISLVGTSDGQGPTPRGLPPDWASRSGPSACQFAYTHPRSSLTFELALTKLGGKIVVAGIAVEAGNAHSLEATVANLLRTGDFPVQLPEPLSPEPSGLGFLSMPIAQTYISDVRQRIIEKLVPGLSDQSALPRVFNDAIAPVPPSGDRGPPPIAGPAHNPSTSPRGQNPLSIGQSDLDPLGGRAPVVPPPFGGAASPTGGLPVPGPSRGGGMYVGPDHPLFDSRRWNSDRGAPHGPFGGDGFLPAGAVPPGARFDPVVPGIGPRGAGGPARGSPFGGLSLGLPLHGGLGRGQRGMPSGGDPDWDELPPPGRDAGYDDMFS